MSFQLLFRMNQSQNQGDLGICAVCGQTATINANDVLTDTPFSLCQSCYQSYEDDIDEDESLEDLPVIRSIFDPNLDDSDLDDEEFDF